MSIVEQAAEVIRSLGWDGGDAAQIMSESLAEYGLLAPEMTTEYGFHYTGYPTTVADWQEWSEDPADNWVWFTDRDQRDEEGVHAEDTGFNVDYFTRQVTAPTPDDMEHIE